MRRVVITGIGLVCPFGRHLNELWESALAGSSAVVPLTVTNAASGVALTVPAAPVPAAALSPLPKHLTNMAGRFAHFGWQAGNDAVTDAGLQAGHYAPERFGTAFGTHLGGLGEIEAQFDHIYLAKRSRVHPFTVVRSMNNSPNAFLQTAFGITGPALTYSTTCSSSLVAVGEAARQIRHGYADAMLAGGADAALNHATLNGWVSAQLIAPMHEDPAASCRPFDVSRCGTVLGEGGVFVVLEERESALARGARVYAELAGYATAADTGHMSQPSVEGQARSMRLALQDAGSDHGEIGLLVAHGTGTKLNDAVETRATRDVLGARAEQVGIVSTKGAVGHMVGAAGAMNLVYGLLALHTRQLPASANLRERDPECDLDVLATARPAPQLAAALCNAFGFGGPAASVVLRQPS